jgi:hypothetical protein
MNAACRDGWELCYLLTVVRRSRRHGNTCKNPVGIMMQRNMEDCLSSYVMYGIKSLSRDQTPRLVPHLAMIGAHSELRFCSSISNSLDTSASLPFVSTTLASSSIAFLIIKSRTFCFRASVVSRSFVSSNHRCSFWSRSSRGVRNASLITRGQGSISHVQQGGYQTWEETYCPRLPRISRFSSTASGSMDIDRRKSSSSVIMSLKKRIKCRKREYSAKGPYELRIPGLT